MDLTTEKGVSLVIFFLITIGVGSLPVLLYTQCRGRMSSRRGQAVISLLNCFSGGVFLGTCLLFLLTEGLEEYEEFKQESGFGSGYPFFHLAIGAGFFTVAFVERFALVMSRRGFRQRRKSYPMMESEEGTRVVEAVGREGGEVVTKIDEVKMTISAPTTTTTSGEGGEVVRKIDEVEMTISDSTSATTSGESSEVVRKIDEVMMTISAPTTTTTSPEDSNHHNHNHNNNDTNVKKNVNNNATTTTTTNTTYTATNKSNNTVTCPNRHSPCSLEEKEGTERFTGHMGVKAVTIFLALSFHTVFDGLAVGLQETQADVWATTIAISIHKTIVALSLGLQLAATAAPGKAWKALAFLSVFALMAPLGVAIGMGVTSGKMDESAHLLASGVLQGVASGSFLYVVFFEVLGEELGHRSSVVNIVVTMLGFSAMALVKNWDSH